MSATARLPKAVHTMRGNFRAPVSTRTTEAVA